MVCESNLLENIMGFRSTQEVLLQCARDKIFLENLPRYERIARELENGKGTTSTKEEFLRWLKNPE